MNKVYQIITDRICEKLEQGTVPWRKPWAGGGAPRNLMSKKAYRGINPFLLASSGFDSPYWLTFKQARAKGGSVSRGQKGTPVIFWKQWEKEVEGEKQKLFVLRYYSVFNLRQCEFPDDVSLPEDSFPVVDGTFDPIPSCEKIAAGFKGSPEVVHEGSRACYNPASDVVTMPPGCSFSKPEEYYSTLFHELTHSTGHATRLKRDGVTGPIFFGSKQYSKEELVAEMGAAFLMGTAGGVLETTIDNSASYLDSWLRKLRRDPKLIVQAAGQAQKSSDLILGTTWD